jgi:hypothetical protein
MALLFLVLAPSVTAAQTSQLTPPSVPVTYQPITSEQRLDWVVGGFVAPQNLAVGALTTAWVTALNTPEEWNRSWSGFGKRYLAREADVGIANTIEGGLGAIWGEDPRYQRSRRDGIWPRVGDAAAATVLAPRRDGHLAPAWGRFAGKTLNTQIENTWLPPSVTTARGTTIRVANSFLGRFVGNLWQEFWPDIRAAIGR